MAENKPDQLVCIVCGKSGTKDDFTVEFDDLCMNCSRESYTAEEESLESISKSFSGFEIRDQKNDGDQLEKETGDMDREDAVQREKGRLSEQPKEENPVEKIHVAATAARVQVSVEPEMRRQKKMADEIESAIETGRYFYVGQAKVRIEGGSARNALLEHEGRESYPKWFWKKPNHHDDNRFKYSNLKLVKIFSTQPIDIPNDVYTRLRDGYLENSFCVNDKNSTDPIPETKRGIVYLRIYEKNDVYDVKSICD